MPEPWPIDNIVQTVVQSIAVQRGIRMRWFLLSQHGELPAFLDCVGYNLFDTNTYLILIFDLYLQTIQTHPDVIVNLFKIQPQHIGAEKIADDSMSTPEYFYLT